MTHLWNFIGRLVAAAMFDVLDPFVTFVKSIADRIDTRHANAINTPQDEL